MTYKIILDIFNWTRLCQINYDRKFKESIDSISHNYFFQILDKKNKTKINDSRVILGGLRYTPFAIGLLLKSLPMPWTLDKQLDLFIHDSKSLIIINACTNNFPEFLSSLWSIFWILNRKEKINRKYFQRINFPLFDDDEESFNLGKKSISNQKKVLEASIYLDNHIKTWLCSSEVFCQHSKSSKKKSSAIQR